MDPKGEDDPSEPSSKAAQAPSNTPPSAAYRPLRPAPAAAGPQISSVPERPLRPPRQPVPAACLQCRRRKVKVRNRRGPKTLTGPQGLVGSGLCEQSRKKYLFGTSPWKGHGIGFRHRLRLGGARRLRRYQMIDAHVQTRKGQPSLLHVISFCSLLRPNTLFYHLVPFPRLRKCQENAVVVLTVRPWTYSAPTGTRPTCFRCANQGLDCHWDTEPDTTRVESPRRRNEELERENDDLHELLRFLSFRPEEEALEILKRLRATGDALRVLDLARMGDLLLGKTKEKDDDMDRHDDAKRARTTQFEKAP